MALTTILKKKLGSLRKRVTLRLEKGKNRSLGNNIHQSIRAPSGRNRNNVSKKVNNNLQHYNSRNKIPTVHLERGLTRNKPLGRQLSLMEGSPLINTEKTKKSSRCPNNIHSHQERSTDRY